MLTLEEWVALLESGKAEIGTQALVTTSVVAFALLLLMIYEKWIRVAIEKVVWRSHNTWDDYIFSDKSLELLAILSHFLSFIMLYHIVWKRIHSFMW